MSTVTSSMPLSVMISNNQALDKASFDPISSILVSIHIDKLTFSSNLRVYLKIIDLYLERHYN